LYSPYVISETKQWLAVNKPAGLNVEQLWDYPSLESWALTYLKQRTGRAKPYVGLVHRLDRFTSGVVLLARNKSTLRMLQAQFARRTVRKVYRAQVEGVLQPGTSATLVHYLEKDQQAKQAFAYARAGARRKRATLRYSCLATQGGQSSLEIWPHTGRYHQIRVQLAAQGWPIVGDVTYGASTTLADKRIMLHAQSITFTDPLTNQPISLEAPVPAGESWLTEI